MTIPWPAEEIGLDDRKPKKGVITKLFGVVFIFLGALDSMMAWRGGFTVSTSFAVLIVIGLALYAAGSVRGRTGE
ncbi:MAG TPA: hypothetical protein VLA28_09435 [Afifellaceae bacterium]|nr:hypothetical protein [Afifellaceae bacterium]